MIDNEKVEQFVAWLRETCVVNTRPNSYTSYSRERGNGRLKIAACIHDKTVDGRVYIVRVDLGFPDVVEKANAIFGPEFGHASDCFEGKQATWWINGKTSSSFHNTGEMK